MSRMLLHSLLKRATFIHRCKQLWSVHTVQLVPFVQGLEPQITPARSLHMTVICSAGHQRNTKKKLVSIYDISLYILIMLILLPARQSGSNNRKIASARLTLVWSHSTYSMKAGSSHLILHEDHMPVIHRHTWCH